MAMLAGDDDGDKNRRSKKSRHAFAQPEGDPDKHNVTKQATPQQPARARCHRRQEFRSSLAARIECAGSCNYKKAEQQQQQWGLVWSGLVFGFVPGLRFSG